MTLPVASTTATFTPVRKPGIEAHGGTRPGRRRQQQRFQIAGEDIDCLGFGALAQRAIISSVSRWTKLLTRQVQRTVSLSHASAGRFRLRMPKCAAMCASQGLCGASHFGFSASESSRSDDVQHFFAAAPEHARARCEGMVSIVSE